MEINRIIKVKYSFTTKFEYQDNKLAFNTNVVYEPLYFKDGNVISMSRFRIAILLRYLKAKVVVLKMLDYLDFNSYLK